MNNLTPEEKATGRDNYYSAVTAHDQWGPTMNRRNFLAATIAAGATGAGIGGM